MDLHSARTLAKLSLRLCCLCHGSLYFDIGVIMHVSRHKRWQTFSSVLGTQLQTSCNPQTSSCSYYRSLGSRYWQRRSYNVAIWRNSFSDRCNVVIDNSFFLLHQNFLQAASSTISSSWHYSRTREPNNTVEYITVQKDGVHCTVVAVGFGFVLFAV